MNELHLFAGAGGGILAGQLLGHRCVCAVERDAYAQAVLLARQNDGTFPPFPIWDDVTTFDGRPWRGIVDVIAGGFPCQDISSAGRGAGITGARSGLWSEMARIIGEVRPRFVFVENSPLLVKRGLAVVISDLAKMGYDAQWCCVSASNLGAPHKRDRLWILAYAQSIPEREQADKAFAISACRQARDEPWGCGEYAGQMANANGPHGERNKRAERGDTERAKPFHPARWPSEPELGRVVDGMAHRSHRLKAIGNGQVPRVAAAAFKILSAQ